MSEGARPGARGPAELRPLKITPDFVSTADGSVFMELGGTRVLCSAHVVSGVPAWRRGSGMGWMTAELGRQPWLVYGVLLTRDGYSATVSSGNTLFSLLGFMGLYLVLGVLFLFLAGREIAHGPEGR